MNIDLRSRPGKENMKKHLKKDDIVVTVCNYNMCTLKCTLKS